MGLQTSQFLCVINAYCRSRSAHSFTTVLPRPVPPCSLIDIDPRPDHSLRQFSSHPRTWRDNFYVYPVISRRSGGLSIGVNLNPDAACNFDCIYCQVDRSTAPRVRDVEPATLRRELAELLQLAQTGDLFAEPEFSDVPSSLRAVRDVAFSGDGEPTTCRSFAECVAIATEELRAAALNHVPIVVITDACYLTRPEVARGLELIDRHGGEIWAKLDAGTEEYYRLINRPNYALAHVMDQIVAAAQVRPVVIQSIFMRVRGEPPSSAQLRAYVDRLSEIVHRGGRIKYVQVYTVARRPAESFVAPLQNQEVDAIVELVRTAGLSAEPYYAAQ